MSFSGLRNLPNHWDAGSLKWEASIYAGGTPSRDEPSYWGGDIPWLGSGEVNQNTITVPTECITNEGYHSSSAKWVPNGALVMALAGQGKTKGMVARLAIEATCNQSLAAIVPTAMVSGYVFWFLTSCYRDIRNLGGGDGRDGLNLRMIGDIRIPLPPRDEQIAIAAFLDYETDKIDGLIAEQERLITLLGEKRQTVISHAVTKGLDSDIEMKDSRIEWMGEVPTHWQVTRVREAASLVNGYPFDSNKFSQDTGHPLVRIRDLGCRQTALLYDGDFIDAAKVDGNDLLIGMDGDFNVGRWKGQGEALLNQRVCCLRGDSAVVRWLEYVIPYPLKLINDVTYSTTVKHLSSGQVLDIRIPLPRGNEMGVLLDHLDKAVGRLDNLSNTAKEGILLLKERRSALISAAVTGKIDVRNHPAAVAALNENKD